MSSSSSSSSSSSFLSSLSSSYHSLTPTQRNFLIASTSIGSIAIVSLLYKYRQYAFNWPLIKSLVTGTVKPFPHPSFKEEQLLRHVYNRAAEGNPSSCMAVIDDFCRKVEWMMNIGDKKGEILKREVENKKPRVAVELGGYCGYSALLIGSCLPADGHLYSIEIDPLHAAIATKILEFAGLKEKVTVIVGTIAEKWKYLQSKYKVETIDLLFLDHAKEWYLKDIKLIEQLGFIKSGTVVVGDNIIFPGAPDYLEYMQNNPNYSSELIHGTIEYNDDIKDAVLISVRK